jgi:hypothetical protein
MFSSAAVTTTAEKLNILEAIKDSIPSTKPIIWTTVVKDEIWIADNFFTPAECKKLIELSEKVGYTEAAVNIGENKGYINKNYRDSDRVMIDDTNLASYIFEKCKNHMPIAYEGGYLLETNERMRFLKYDHPGAKFKRHCDANFARNKSEESLITLQVYLSEDIKGGETTFFDPVFPSNKYSCVPKIGRVLLFRQRGWEHEGSILESGLKYTFRTELMYKWLTAEEKDKFKHKICGVCGSLTRFVDLKSCSDIFLMCNCNPFNYRDKFAFYECIFCLKEIKFQADLQLILKNYALTDTNDELTKLVEEAKLLKQS